MLNEEVACEEQYHSKETLIDFLFRSDDRRGDEDDNGLDKMSDEFMLMLIICLNGPHKLVNEDFENINSSFDVLKEMTDIDACNQLRQHDIKQKVNLLFTNTVNF